MDVQEKTFADCLSEAMKNESMGTIQIMPLIKRFSTIELVRELCSREGVQFTEAQPFDDTEMLVVMVPKVPNDFSLRGGDSLAKCKKCGQNKCSCQK